MSIQQDPESGLWGEEIDGKKYLFEKWGAEESLTNLLKITKMVGRPLGIAVGSMTEKTPGKSAMDLELTSDMMGFVFEALTDKMDEGIVVALIKKLASDKVLCDGQKVSFNTHYQDKLDHLLKVVKAALEVQYGNFFAGLLGNLGVKRKGQGITNQAAAT